MGFASDFVVVFVPVEEPAQPLDDKEDDEEHEAEVDDKGE